MKKVNSIGITYIPALVLIIIAWTTGQINGLLPFILILLALDIKLDRK